MGSTKEKVRFTRPSERWPRKPATELAEAELLGPIAKRHVVHGYSDLVIEQDESFFLAMVSPFEVDISAHTPDERLTLLGHRWWTHDDLRHTDEWIWPHELVELWSLAGQPDMLAD